MSRGESESRLRPLSPPLGVERTALDGRQPLEGPDENASDPWIFAGLEPFQTSIPLLY